MQLEEYLNIPYMQTDHGPLNQFDLYVPPSTRPPPLLCYVHGGAWRSEDKSEHADLARRLAQLTSYAVAVPNYRLTKPETPLRHPAHAEDIHQFLNFILAWEGPKGTEKAYDASRIYVFGHSCSAHMLTSILLAPPAGSAPSSLASLTPSTRLLQSVRGIVLSEGIYDIDLLLRSFPTYRDWFIAAAFGDLPSYEAFDTASYKFREAGEHIQWFLIHSKSDTLVDVAQTEKFLASLQDMISGGKGSGSVQTHWELTSEHNALLKEDDYPRIVAKFVMENENNL